MKKIIFIALLTALMLECYGSEKLFNLYHSYRKDQNAVNIGNLFNEIQKELKKDVSEEDTRLVAINFYFDLFNGELKFFEENFDSLTVRSQFGYANILLALEEYDRALKIYDYLNQEAPEWSCPWRHKGEVYYRKGDMENAESAFIKSLEIRENHFDAYIWLAQAQIELKKYEEALQTFEKGLTFLDVSSEHAEEEITDEELLFLKLKLYKYNKKDKEFKELEKTLKNKYPESKKWEEINR
ncbi:MAG: hypothetical protein CSB55_06190 [Candidatus Cloacimonadota bacterium]|nr:MAG: hypothetical protein CSB55_06190 [Candidatus Cloacimonadota bacterium]